MALFRQNDHPLVATPNSSESWRAWLASRSETFFLYARQQTRCQSDAEDVLQEALFESWRRAGGLPPDNALVFATIRRRAMDLARGNDRRTRREGDAGAVEPLFVVDYTASDTRLQLVECVQKLPEHLREVLVLKLWGDLTFPEIAQITGVPVNTASSRYRYALEQLRGALSNSF